MKRPLIIVFSVVAIFLVVGIAAMRTLAPGNTFNAVSRDLSYGMGGGGAAPSVQEPLPAQPPVSESTVSNARDAFNSGQAPQERKVIQNDQLSMVVKDPEKQMKSIIALAQKMNGYVVSSNLFQSTYGPNNTTVPQAQVVIRVPAEKLTEALDQIKKEAIEVQSENLTGQDVTDQYVDLQSRLAADQAAADQLLKIMQSADKTEDVLNVFEQLRQVQSDIEVLKGQIKYIDQSTSTSEISVTLIAEQSVQPIEVGGWKLQGTARDAIQDLVFFIQGFLRFLIRFVLLTVPALILIAIPFFLLFLLGRAIYRRASHARSKGVEVKSEEEKK